jgi:hypothetical protein
MLPEASLILIGILLAITIGAAAEYYRQLRGAQREYEKAKGVVEDIILSYNRQLKHEAQRLEVVAYKVETLASKSDGALSRSEDALRKSGALETQITTGSADRERMSARLDEVERKTRDVAASQEAMVAKITSLEDQGKRLLTAPEVNLEAVIPIRREKAMSPLTVTEIGVLEMLASEGPKTAPEIKERVKLSREHTARLMKKLYEEGYLERETSKIPFKYSIKKEMEKLLKKPESSTT